MLNLKTKNKTKVESWQEALDNNRLVEHKVRLGCLYGSTKSRDYATGLINRSEKISSLIKRTLITIIENQDSITGKCNQTNENLKGSLSLAHLKRGLALLPKIFPGLIVYAKYSDDFCFPQYKKRRQICIDWDGIFRLLSSRNFQPPEIITKAHGEPLRRITSTEFNSSTIYDSSPSLFLFEKNIAGAIGEKNPLGEESLKKENKMKKFVPIAEEKKLADLIEYYDLNIEKKEIFYEKKIDSRLTETIGKLVSYRKPPVNVDEIEEPPVRQIESKVVPLESRFQGIPSDIKAWAARQTPEQLEANIFYKNKQWIILRAGMKDRPPEPNAEPRSPDKRPPVREVIVNKKQMRLKRIREIPILYPDYKEVLKRENCTLAEIEFRMMENFDYDPFEKDMSSFDRECHPKYGFMSQEERDAEFISVVDHWLPKPNEFFVHTDRNKKMFQKARIRADKLKASYEDWVAALYELFGPMQMYWTHINYKKGEETYEKWVKRGKPYPINLGSVKIRRFYMSKPTNGRGGWKQHRLTFEEKMRSAENIVESVGDSWKDKFVTCDRVQSLPNP